MGRGRPRKVTPAQQQNENEIFSQEPANPIKDEPRNLIKELSETITELERKVLSNNPFQNINKGTIEDKNKSDELNTDKKPKDIIGKEITGKVEGVFLGNDSLICEIFHNDKKFSPFVSIPISMDDVIKADTFKIEIQAGNITIKLQKRLFLNPIDL